MTSRIQPLSRTVAAVLGAAALATAAAHHLTLGFEVWTEEGARRLRWALRPQFVPSVLVEGPNLPVQPMRDFIARKGTPTIITFFYSRCETVCSSAGSLLQQAQTELRRGQRVRLLSISFDSQNDDLPTLTSYANKLGADSSVWNLVRIDEPRSIAQTLRFFEVTVLPDGLGGLDHNAALLVVDGEGRLVRGFDLEEIGAAIGFALTLSSGRAMVQASLE